MGGRALLHMAAVAWSPGAHYGLVPPTSARVPWISHEPEPEPEQSFDLPEGNPSEQVAAARIQQTFRQHRLAGAETLIVEGGSEGVDAVGWRLDGLAAISLELAAGVRRVTSRCDKTL